MASITCSMVATPCQSAESQKVDHQFRSLAEFHADDFEFPSDIEVVHAAFPSMSSDLRGLHGKATLEIDVMSSSMSSTEEGTEQRSFSSFHSTPASAASALSDATSADDSDSSDSDWGDDAFLEYTLIARVYPPSFLLNLRPAAKGEPDPTARYGTRPLSDFPADCKDDKAPDTVKAWRPSTTPASAKRTSPSALPAPSAGSWKPPQKKKAASAVTVTDDESVGRSIRLILNKLTVEKFDKLFDQLASCGISKPAHVSLLMREIFEKATGQHHFIAMYADLCVRLGDDERIAMAVTAESDTTFRRLLLNQCQTAFESLLHPEAIDSDAFDDEFIVVRRKKNALGNIKLVGQLLVRGMLGSQILCDVTESLLLARGTCPEALESLAALLTVAGPTFDLAEWQHRPLLEVTFKRVKELTADKSVPARERFLLRDLLDLRESGWPGQVRETALPSGPMRLNEVRERAATEGTTPLNRQIPKVSPKFNASAQPGSIAGILMKPKREQQQQQQSSPSFENAKPSRKPRSGKNGARNTASPSNVQQGPAAQKSPFAAPAVRYAPTPVVAQAAFSAAVFHRALVTILCNLGKDGNIVAAAEKIREQKVPAHVQASEFADFLTRAAEEGNVRARRSAFSLIGHIACPKHQIFDRAACLEGVRMFFDDIFQSLCEDVPQLPAIIRAELLPILQRALPGHVRCLLPASLQAY